MDKLSGLTSKLGGGGKHESSSGGASSNDKKDFVDKGIDSLENKFGGGKVDPNDPKVRQMNEKFTDGARDKVEKSTGWNVPDKVSQ